MCSECRRSAPTRRSFLSLAAAGTAASALLGSGRAFAADAGAGVTAKQALDKLKAGNAAYVSAPDACAINLSKLAQQREKVAAKQTPWAAILACADSRVPPELLFGGLGLGELFVARNAGNMADTATMGTIEYGVEHLGVPLVVVLGHERCGAVAAACEVVEKHTSFPGSIAPMVAAIVPAAQAVYGKPGDFIENTVRESAKRTAAKIAIESPIVSHFIHDRGVLVVAARYDLDNGKVEFLT